VIKQRLQRAALARQQLDLKDPEPFNRLFHDLMYEQERPTYTGLKFQLLVQQLLIGVTEATIAEHAVPRTPPRAQILPTAVLSLIADACRIPICPSSTSRTSCGTTLTMWAGSSGA